MTALNREQSLETLAKAATETVTERHHNDVCGCWGWPDNCPSYPEPETLRQPVSWRVVQAVIGGLTAHPDAARAFGVVVIGEGLTVIRDGGGRPIVLIGRSEDDDDEGGPTP